MKYGEVWRRDLLPIGGMQAGTILNSVISKKLEIERYHMTQSTSGHTHETKIERPKIIVTAPVYHHGT